MLRRFNIHDFLNQEAMAGIFLMIATLIAVLLSNSDFSESYTYLLALTIQVQIGSWGLSEPLLFWVNEGLMTLFFFLIGLELKRERLVGELKNIHHIIRPGVAALGGVLIPILIYSAMNYHDAFYSRGWAIPMATDIAFSVGVLSLFSRRVSLKMKIFLLTLAVLDDLAAVIIIGVFYSHTLHVVPLLVALLAIGGLAALNRYKVVHLLPYVVLGLILWMSILKSGIHATLSGVLLAFFVPLSNRGGVPILEKWERALHPFIAYFVLPLFAFANAGVPIETVGFSELCHPVVLGVSLGLLVGKPVGVIIFSSLYIRLVKQKMDFTKQEMLALGLLAGIGFTMSLFIATLSFGGLYIALLNEARLGILIGSAGAIILSALVLMSLPVLNKR